MLQTYSAEVKTEKYDSIGTVLLLSIILLLIITQVTTLELLIFPIGGLGFFSIIYLIYRIAQLKTNLPSPVGFGLLISGGALAILSLYDLSSFGITFMQYGAFLGGSCVILGVIFQVFVLDQILLTLLKSMFHKMTQIVQFLYSDKYITTTIIILAIADVVLIIAFIQKLLLLLLVTVFLVYLTFLSSTFSPNFDRVKSYIVAKIGLIGLFQAVLAIFLFSFENIVFTFFISWLYFPIFLLYLIPKRYHFILFQEFKKLVHRFKRLIKVVLTKIKFLNFISFLLSILLFILSRIFSFDSPFFLFIQLLIICSAFVLLILPFRNFVYPPFNRVFSWSTLFIKAQLLPFKFKGVLRVFAVAIIIFDIIWFNTSFPLEYLIRIVLLPFLACIIYALSYSSVRYLIKTHYRQILPVLKNYWLYLRIISLIVVIITLFTLTQAVLFWPVLLGSLFGFACSFELFRKSSLSLFKWNIRNILYFTAWIFSLGLIASGIILLLPIEFNSTITTALSGVTLPIRIGISFGLALAGVLLWREVYSRQKDTREEKK